MLLLAWLLAVAAWGRLSLADDPEDILGLEEQDHGECYCIAVDYADRGSYLVDANTDGNFSYASQFQGKSSFSGHLR